MSDSLGGEGGKIAYLHTCNLYLDCLEGGLPPKDDMTVGGGSCLSGIIHGVQD